MGSPRLHFLFCWPGSGRGAASVWQRLCWVGNWTLSRSGAETSLTPFGESVEPTSHRENAGSQLLGAAFRGHPLARFHSFLRPLFATHLLRVRPCPRCWSLCAKKPTTWGVLKGFSAYRFNAVWWIIQQGVQGQWTRRTGAPNLEEVGVGWTTLEGWSKRKLIFKMSKGKQVVLETVKKKQAPNGFTSAKSHQDLFPNSSRSFSFSWSETIN